MSNVRKPTVAGAFYPAGKEELEADLQGMFSRAAEATGNYTPFPNTVGAILPHAGYVFSGFATAVGMLCLKKSIAAPERIILIAPSHQVAFSGLALGTYDALATPVGTLECDVLANRALAAANPNIIVDDRILEREHALEVELPMILKTFENAPKILPVVTGRIYPEEARNFAPLFDEFMDEKTTFIISSDFTHYGPNYGYIPFRENVQNNLRMLDGTAAQIIASGDLSEFGRFLASTGATICGASGIKLLMAILAHHGGGTGQLLLQTSSGEMTGDFTNSVGYCSMLMAEK